VEQIRETKRANSKVILEKKCNFTRKKCLRYVYRIEKPQLTQETTTDSFYFLGDAVNLNEKEDDSTTVTTATNSLNFSGGPFQINKWCYGCHYGMLSRDSKEDRTENVQPLFLLKNYFKKKEENPEETISVQVVDGIDRDFGANIEKTNMLFDGDICLQVLAQDANEDDAKNALIEAEQMGVTFITSHNIPRNSWVIVARKLPLKINLNKYVIFASCYRKNQDESKSQEWNTVPVNPELFEGVEITRLELEGEILQATSWNTTPSRGCNHIQPGDYLLDFVTTKAIPARAISRMEKYGYIDLITKQELQSAFDENEHVWIFAARTCSTNQKASTNQKRPIGRNLIDQIDAVAETPRQSKRLKAGMTHSGASPGPNSYKKLLISPNDGVTSNFDKLLYKHIEDKHDSWQTAVADAVKELKETKLEEADDVQKKCHKYVLYNRAGKIVLQQISEELKNVRANSSAKTINTTAKKITTLNFYNYVYETQYASYEKKLSAAYNATTKKHKDQNKTRECKKHYLSLKKTLKQFYIGDLVCENHEKQIKSKNAGK